MIHAHTLSEIDLEILIADNISNVNIFFVERYL